MMLMIFRIHRRADDAGISTLSGIRAEYFLIGPTAFKLNAVRCREAFYNNFRIGPLRKPPAADLFVALVFGQHQRAVTSKRHAV